MRRLTVAADDLGALHILPAQVAVGVAADRDGQMRPDDLANRRQDMALAGADLLYLAGTVEMEIDAVQLGLMFPHCAEEAGLDIIERLLLDDTRGTGCRIDRGDHFDAGIGKNVLHLHLVDAVLTNCDHIIGDVVFQRHIWDSVVK